MHGRGEMVEKAYVKRPFVRHTRRGENNIKVNFCSGKKAMAVPVSIVINFRVL